MKYQDSLQHSEHLMQRRRLYLCWKSSPHCLSWEPWLESGYHNKWGTHAEAWKTDEARDSVCLSTDCRQLHHIFGNGAETAIHFKHYSNADYKCLLEKWLTFVNLPFYSKLWIVIFYNAYSSMLLNLEPKQLHVLPQLSSHLNDKNGSQVKCTS